jgi:hypothetical protein
MSSLDRGPSIVGLGGNKSRVGNQDNTTPVHKFQKVEYMQTVDLELRGKVVDGETFVL